MSEQIKAKYHAEVDLAFKIYEMLGSTEWGSWHRILSIVEQIRNKDQMLKEECAKQAYAANRPIGVP